MRERSLYIAVGILGAGIILEIEKLIKGSKIGVAGVLEKILNQEYKK